MNADLLIFVVVFVSVSAGFLLGAYGRHLPIWQRYCSFYDGFHSSSSSGPGLPGRHYFEGLSYLLDDQPDAAIDSFISAMDVRAENLETHLALGSLLRKRGELSRAVKIHQNLLARPNLSRQQLHQVQFELAIDFFRSGLLDRAEALLQELADGSGIESELRHRALGYLVELYQDTGEWMSAIDCADRLTTRKFTGTADKWRFLQAQFSCQLAETAIRDKDWMAARRYLHDAQRFDKNSVRAIFLLSQLDFFDGNVSQGVALLSEVPHLAPQYIPDVVPLIKTHFLSLYTPQAWLHELQRLYHSYPSLSLLNAISHQLDELKGFESVIEWLGGELVHYPQLSVVKVMVAFFRDNALKLDDSNYSALRTELYALFAESIKYECHRCGYVARDLDWQCPSCKSWSTCYVSDGH